MGNFTPILILTTPFYFSHPILFKDKIQIKFTDITTLLPRIQAHPLIGTPVPNPNKGACA